MGAINCWALKIEPTKGGWMAWPSHPIHSHISLALTFKHIKIAYFTYIGHSYLPCCRLDFLCYSGVYSELQVGYFYYDTGFFGSLVSEGSDSPGLDPYNNHLSIDIITWFLGEISWSTSTGIHVVQPSGEL